MKGSDRRPFILILDWILVYAFGTMWMNLSPYPNLWRAEKLKSQSILKIIRKIFSQFIWHILYVTNSRKSVWKYSIFNNFWVVFTYYFIWCFLIQFLRVFIRYFLSVRKFAKKFSAWSFRNCLLGLEVFINSFSQIWWCP